jgi:hypothetical protein
MARYELAFSITVVHIEVVFVFFPSVGYYPRCGRLFDFQPLMSTPVIEQVFNGCEVAFLE